MHFLCLHGMGTNSEILKLQTALIRHHLGSEHTYDFVDGPYNSPPAPGIETLLSLASTDNDLPPSDEVEFFAFHSQDSDEPLDSLRKTLADLKDYVLSEGPFDGVIGFSQGAGIAASLLIQQRQQDLTESLLRPMFKCAIFFSGCPPGDVISLPEPDKSIPDTAKDKYAIRWMNKKEDGVVIRIPTAHVWGKNDTLWPGFGPILADLSNESNREIVVWDGAHEIPGLGGDNGVKEAVTAIKRTIHRAIETH